ncbi:MAG: 2-succinyl-5-enolpyruvyl-6-hydroxy-3-cyclohexene-1-carboxylic-acid synthase [Burkholderiales bacterium]|jgi:2-succinyl-5-enolpyruvyl-6-hydroxy-3-cyclohexene-1-carboxylate synthase|nr:2-succinyl-5-enolpyruvyl-6-hydroxy-3-cyclohexene-1-carboxylic-acid synthase [Burkholderiales bacterium]
MDHQAELNRRFARVILETLTRHRVRHVCIAPGSRSTPLTLEAAAISQLITHTHFDERGLGHLALGVAKATQEPVAVIVTSGTAVANLLPAAIEAKFSGEKLILLTADRPQTLQHCGANQAVGQERLFEHYATDTISLPTPAPDVSAAWLTSVLDDALARLTHGALHVNCPFSEPLYGEMSNTYQVWSDTLLLRREQNNTPWLQSGAPKAIQEEPDWAHWRQKKGIVVAGALRPHEGALLRDWANELGWLLLSDVLSHTGQPQPYVNLWLTGRQARQITQEAEIIIQFGKHLTGKALLLEMARLDPQQYWVVDPLPGRLDPAHHQGRRIVSPVDAWLACHPPEASQFNEAWRALWSQPINALVEQSKTAIANTLTRDNTYRLTEAWVAHHLPELLPQDGQLLLGNSLMIRLVDALAQFPCAYPVHANRGASGIDGLVATAMGVAVGNQKPTLAVLGDLSALYDLNSLALARALPHPMVLIVINNNGGSIFSMLPTPPIERDRYYRMPHDLTFEHAAALFGLRFDAPQTPEELKNAVAHAFRQSVATLIEVRVSPDEGALTLKSLSGSF